MTDKLDITKLLEVARAAQAELAVDEMGEIVHKFIAEFTPAVAIALCERVRELERDIADFSKGEYDSPLDDDPGRSR